MNRKGMSLLKEGMAAEVNSGVSGEDIKEVWYIKGKQCYCLYKKSWVRGHRTRWN
jgi:hypothetical protein